MNRQLLPIEDQATGWTGWPLLYDRQEAAEVLHTSLETIDRLVAEGRLSSVQLSAEEPPQFRPQDLVYFVDTDGDEEAEWTALAIREAVAASRGTPESTVDELLASQNPEDFVHVVDPSRGTIERAAAQASALQDLRELLEGLPELTLLVEHLTAFCWAGFVTARPLTPQLLLKGEK